MSSYKTDVACHVRSIEVISDKFNKSRRETSEKLRELGSELDDKQRDMNIAKTGFAVTGIVGTSLAVAGLVVAFLTFGASLGLTIAGTGIGVASGVGSLATAIANAIINGNTMKEAKAAVEAYQSAVEDVLGGVQILMNRIEQDKGDTFRKELCQKLAALNEKKKSAMINAILRGIGGGLNDFKTQGVRVGGLSASIGAAAVRTAAGTVVKGLRIGGAVLSVVTIPLDLHTLVSNSIKIYKKTPSEVAEQIREIARSIEEHEMQCDF